MHSLAFFGMYALRWRWQIIDVELYSKLNPLQDLLAGVKVPETVHSVLAQPFTQGALYYCAWALPYYMFMLVKLRITWYFN